MVRLEKTGVTDGWLSHLGALSTLRFLDLSETKVTDAGIKYLERLQGLDCKGYAHESALKITANIVIYSTLP